MAQQMIRGGAPVDIPSTAEIGDVVSERARQVWQEQAAIAEAQEREQARALKFVRRVQSPGTNTAGIDGPEQGYAWFLMAVTAIFSAGSDLCVFLGAVKDYSAAAGSPGASNLPVLGVAGSGQEAATNLLARVSWGYREQIIYPGESVTVVAQNGSANISKLLVTAIQFPQEKIGVLLA